MSGAYSDDYIYVGMNSHWETHDFELPQLPEAMLWRIFVNTSAYSAQPIRKPGAEPILDNQQAVTIGARSVVILTGR
jgi:glycogen operon protein